MPFQSDCRKLAGISRRCTQVKQDRWGLPACGKNTIIAGITTRPKSLPLGVMVQSEEIHHGEARRHEKEQIREIHAEERRSCRARCICCIRGKLLKTWRCICAFLGSTAANPGFQFFPFLRVSVPPW